MSKIQLTQWTSISESECPKICKVLLQKSSDDFATYIKLFPEEINLETKDNLTVLMVAVENNKVDTVKMLIEAGADLNKQSNNGWTALIFAARYGKTEIAKLLIDAKADFNKQDKDGKTALDYAKKDNYQQIIDLIQVAQSAQVTLTVTSTATQEDQTIIKLTETVAELKKIIDKQQTFLSSTFTNYK